MQQCTGTLSGFMAPVERFLNTTINQQSVSRVCLSSWSVFVITLTSLSYCYVYGTDQF